MPPTGTTFTGDRPESQIALDYVPSEEEMAIINQCKHDAFWYRTVPTTVVSVAVTRGLFAKGFLTPSPRFGFLPKITLACVFGLVVGNISCLKMCQERLKMLDTPLGQFLRQKRGLPPLKSRGVQSEPSDQESESFESMFQSKEANSQRSYNTESPMQMDKLDDFSDPVESHLDEVPKRKAILYEDLRVKNRENYEVTLTQKAETLLKPSPERESKRPPKVKNIYGDTWED